jgi:hypothetical protein
MECSVKAHIAMLQMWLLLKSERPDEAWEHLIAAQSNARFAQRAHDSFSDHSNISYFLEAIERLVFPQQVFLSAGLIVGREVCSICQDDYHKCGHIVGRAYSGVFCHRILMDSIADHVAIVQEPANKLCRMTHFNVEGGKRNRMTWRIEPNPTETKQQTDQSGGLVTQGIILTLEDTRRTS